MADVLSRFTYLAGRPARWAGTPRLPEAGPYFAPDRHVLGRRFGRAPLEDWLHGLALYLVAVSTWSWGRGDA